MPPIREMPIRPFMRMYRAANRIHASGRVGWWAARALSTLNRTLYGIEIDPRAQLDPTVYVPHPVGIVIGERVVVGAGTIIMPLVVLGSAKWGSPDRHPVVGEDVLIGAGAKVLGPISVGDKARIGANAVVVTDVPAAATVAGMPAKVVS